MEDVREELEFEVEALGTVATQVFERVARQATQVQALCASMEEQAVTMKAWNRLIRRGQQVAREAEEGAQE
eukprot:CAMPEP_0184538074 /NCGR_PEP_ID=MMETSP0198_2-20121128/17402_1 /TAXON_ID=1112570 /ORGANISM="Thraustochytrium sp., Strain LLF1b" /LENGTH=70 /DNA_ID=CAMNT_0026931505 /DNA_START=18 /DNA_END=230 /DNA_ORIENTATION=-